MREASVHFLRNNETIDSGGSALTRIAMSLKTWADATLNFIYPEHCRLCGQHRAAQSDSYVCEKCRAAVKFVEPPYCEHCGMPFRGALTTKFECGNCKELELHFDYARSAVIAGEKILGVIHRYKYHRALWFETFLAGLLIERAKPELAKEAWHLIVPVPLYGAKLREREFNQAERLGACLSAATGIPMETNLVRRVQPTRTQTQLTRQERLANVRKAFALKGSADLAGKSLILVDDVLTTGATTSACARVLRKAGADKVCVWTVARGT
jgi:competence protein ComFC